MKKSLVTVAAIAALAVPAVSNAAPFKPGPYASAFLGVTIPKDTTITAYDFNGTQQLDDRVEFDPGVFVGGTFGYDFGIVRLEGELSYKHSDINAVTDRITVPPTRYRDVDGSLGVLAFMANGFIDLHNDTPVTPYFGGGIGVAALNLTDTHDNRTGDRLYRDDSATAFAYQAGAGVDIALNRRISLDLGYRYFGTANAEFESEKQVNRTSTAELKYESHNVTAGVRFKF